MKELEFLEIIHNTLDVTSFLGDDCAFLDDLGIFITHDTLVEDVHFSMYTTTAYKLGRKAVNVNLSDLAASMAIPKYVTVSISLPKLTKNTFVEEFYRGINDVCNEHCIKVAGGDITGSDKIIISISAIGKKVSPFFASRKNSKKNDLIVVTGDFGSSSAGFYGLSNFLYTDEELIDKHLNPHPRIGESKILSDTINRDITIMDCSDGLVDALYKISKASSHTLKIDINKVPVSKETKDFCTQNNLDWKHFVKWGGEDYELLACIPADIFEKLDKNKFTCIGTVLNKDTNPQVIIQDNEKVETITKNKFEDESYNHFNCK